MICRRELRAGLIAALLVLAGCSASGGDAPSQTAPDPPRDPALAALLTEAEAAIAEGRLADAGRGLDAARVLAPDDPDVWTAIARLRFRGGEHLAAVEAADRALALGPDHGPALLMRALMVRDAHGFAAAQPWFEAAVAADPGNADTLAEYAATLGDGGEAGAMLAAVRRLAVVAPDDPRVPYLQAVLAARAGQYPLARSLLLRSGMAARGVPAAMQLDAVIALAEGNAESAATILEALLERQPANRRVRDLLARALLDGGREDALIARFAAEAARPDASPYLALLVARAFERSGDRAGAAPLLAKAYGVAQRAPVTLGLGDGLPTTTASLRRPALEGDWTSAQAAALALAARFPGSADVAILAGDVALGAGDPATALAAYARAMGVKRPWHLTGKAALALRQAGDDAAADALMARHVAGAPDSPPALVTLAAGEARRGEWARTALLLDHAIALGAGHDPALLNLRLDAARALGSADDAKLYSDLLALVRPRPLAVN